MKLPVNIIIRTFLSIGLFLIFSNITVEAYSTNIEYEGLYFHIFDNGNAEVVAPDNTTYEGADYQIPSFIIVNDKKISVMGIGNRAFMGSTSLISVTFPEEIKYIGDKAFAYCVNLEKIIWPTFLNRIGENAFSYCDSLGPDLELPEVNEIQNGAFSYCKNLKTANILKTSKEYGESIFTGCINLKSIKLNPLIKEIPSYMFQDCKSLESISIPEKTEIIGEFAFSNCTSLKEIYIPEKINHINSRAFSNCSGIKDLKFGCKNSVIGFGAFERNTSITSIYINGVRQIEERAFADCCALEWIEIEHGVEEIGSRAFSGCSGLEVVYSHPNWPPAITPDTFDQNTENNASLVVAVGNLRSYDMAAYWDKFKHISESRVFPVGIHEIAEEKDSSLKITKTTGELMIKYTGDACIICADGRIIKGKREGEYVKFPSIEGIKIFRTDRGAHKFY